MILTILLICFGIFVFVFLLCLGYLISGYNRFVSIKQDIGTQWSNIKTEYQRRADLFYNLVETVKSYKKFESQTLKDIISARSGAFIGNGTKEEQAKKMSKLDGMFSRLLAIVENYPILKSSEQHNKLMDEVRITEDRINVSRTDYNSIVRDYNVYVNSFPSNIIAGMFKFQKETFFVNEEDSNKSPKINLN